MIEEDEKLKIIIYEIKTLIYKIFLLVIIIIFLMWVAFIPYSKDNNININNNKQIGNITSEEYKININTATFEELDSLDGIGFVKAGMIIDNRPYNEISELLNVLTEEQYDKIKSEVKIE